jgi:hypothetical protein
MTSLPELFSDYDTTQIFKWEADPIVVSTTTRLITLDRFNMMGKQHCANES